MSILPALFAVLGLFMGRDVARKKRLCPHRTKVWGAVLLPLLLLVVMMDQAPLVFMVSMGAAVGAGATAHAPMALTLVSTTFAVTIATLVALKAAL